MNTFQTSNKLEVKDLKKVFGELKVLENINLHVKENEFVTILGPSGSGKSTIFNVIAGLLMPESGDVIIDGQSYLGRTARVSYMYQKDLLLPWKKIVDNVALPLIVKGLSKREARAKALKHFQLFGLEGFENKYPFQLSGGMKQRAALMRTYMFSSDIMLLDEPFGGLDAITRSKLHFWLLEVLEQTRSSVLFITHDIEEAIFLSDRIYILSDRPASIKEEIAVNLPKPRDRSLITSVEFNKLKSHIMETL